MAWIVGLPTLAGALFAAWLIGGWGGEATVRVMDDLGLVAFGLFSLTYGSLILLQIPLVRGLIAVPPETLGYVIFDVSYMVTPLGMFYAEQVRGRGWFSIVRRSWQVGFSLAAVLAVYDLATGRPGAGFVVYQVYLVVALLILLPHVILFQHLMSPVDEDEAEQLRARQIRVIPGEVASLQVDSDHLVGVRLVDGTVHRQELPRTYNEYVLVDRDPG